MTIWRDWGRKARWWRENSEVLLPRGRKGKEMKILHIADEHLRDRNIEEIEKCIDFIVATARSEIPNMIISAGDLFDSQDIKMGSRSALTAIGFISALADIAPVAIVLGTSSHDGKAPEILRFARGAHPIIVAATPMQVYLEEGGLFDRPAGDKNPEAVVTLIPQPTKQFFQTRAGIEASDLEIGHAMSGLFAGFGAQAAAYPGVPHVLAGHWNVNGCRLANGQIRTGMDIEVSVDQMNMGNFDLGCLGHIHKAQTLGEKYFYSGPIYSTKIDEEGPMGFWVHAIGPLGIEGGLISDFIETPCRRMVRIQDDYTKGGVGELPEISEKDFSGAHVRHEITVWQDEAGKVDKAAIEKYFMDAGALSVDIRINAVPRVNIRAESVLKAETLRDEIQAMAELRGETVDPETLAMAEELENTPGEELLGRIAGGAL